ncbi:hypothetical protein [Geminicoccus harenae]|nr:hypothetical protein [Geminicoccus harenae]
MSPTTVIGEQASPGLLTAAGWQHVEEAFPPTTGPSSFGAAGSFLELR